MTRPALVLALALIACAPACSTVDLDALERGGKPGSPESLVKLHERLDGRAKRYSIYVAPVAVVASEDVLQGERSERYSLLVNRERLARELERCLTGVFERVVVSTEIIDRPGDAESKLAFARLRAYEAKCDFILLPTVTRFDAVFVDTTAAWWPDALFLAWYFYFPTWAIGDEVYGAQARIEYSVESLRNEQPLPGLAKASVVVDSLVLDRNASGDEVPRGPRVAMDDLDRGISILRDMFEIFFTPGQLDRDQWSTHVQPIMEPYARRHAAMALAGDLVEKLEALDSNPEAKARALSATHAVVVGVEDYPQRCPRADSDATAFAARVSRRTPEKLVRKLVNQAATAAEVLRAIGAAVADSRPDDTIVFYFAGRGVATDPTTLKGLGLALAGATRQSQAGSPEVLSLERLAKELDGGEGHARRRFVVLDTTFGGGDRGSADSRQAIDHAKLEALLGSLAGTGVLFLASDSEAPANVLEAAGQGLLTYALLDGVDGAADPDRQGLTWEKLRAHVERTVRTLSRLEAETEQRPIAILHDAGPPKLLDPK